MKILSHNIRIAAAEIQGFDFSLKNLINRIPGIPSKEEALKLVRQFRDKNPARFNKLVDSIGGQLPGMAGKTAFDFKGLVNNFKGLADPKVILGIIALMGAFGTVDAKDISKHLDKDTVQEQSISHSHMIKYNEFDLMGTNRIDIQVVDKSTAEVVEAKGFTNDKAGAQKFLKQMQKKYPGSKIVK